MQNYVLRWSRALSKTKPKSRGSRNFSILASPTPQLLWFGTNQGVKHVPCSRNHFFIAGTYGRFLKKKSRLQPGDISWSKISLMILFPLNPPRITLALHQQSFLRSCRESWEYQCMPSSLSPHPRHWFPLLFSRQWPVTSRPPAIITCQWCSVITIIQVYLYTNTSPPSYTRFRLSYSQPS